MISLIRVDKCSVPMTRRQGDIRGGGAAPKKPESVRTVYHHPSASSFNLVKGETGVLEKV